jgi:hypothetical protein
VTGPEHYLEGERLLAGPLAAEGECITGSGREGHWLPTDRDLLEAQTQFLAALVALTAEDKFPLSVSWQKAVGW